MKKYRTTLKNFTATIKIRAFVLIIAVFAGLQPATAQTQADSDAFAGAKWDILLDSTGVVCKKTSFRIFDSDQRISVIEISPEYFSTKVYQPEYRITLRDMAVRNDAPMAVNGGFFDTSTDKAVANDFIKTDSVMYPDIARGWGSAALGIDKDGHLHYRAWNRQDSVGNYGWQEEFVNVIVAGPMLVESGQNIAPAFEADPVAHPRTIIGNKPDGTIVMAVIDGRGKKRDGMALWHAAVIAQMLGMENCINLDGGGSSAMWMKNRGYINKPSDKLLFIRFPRQVANAIIVVPK